MIKNKINDPQNESWWGRCQPIFIIYKKLVQHLFIQKSRTNFLVQTKNRSDFLYIQNFGPIFCINKKSEAFLVYAGIAQTIYICKRKT